jgi:hypothetical protein
MTNGELLYLLLVLAGFGTFMLAVAWADHQYRQLHCPARQATRRHVDAIGDHSPAG